MLLVVVDACNHRKMLFLCVKVFSFLGKLYVLSPDFCHNLKVLNCSIVRPSYDQGWSQEFYDGGQNLPTRGLKYGFQGTINAKYLRKKLLFTVRL